MVHLFELATAICQNLVFGCTNSQGPKVLKAHIFEYVKSKNHTPNWQQEQIAVLKTWLCGWARLAKYPALSHIPNVSSYHETRARSSRRDGKCPCMPKGEHVEWPPILADSSRDDPARGMLSAQPVRVAHCTAKFPRCFCSCKRFKAFFPDVMLKHPII